MNKERTKTRAGFLGARQLPKKIGIYDVISLLGLGATSSVYLVQNEKTHRKYALKMLNEGHVTAWQRKMFNNEAALCGRLQHKNIAAILDVVSDKDGNYLIIEYVEGASLDKYSSPETLLPVDVVIEVIKLSAEALNYSYKQGVIHRDIKPANIILSNDCMSVKLMDFGCAHISGEDTGFELGVAGSINYMSPEQCLGEVLDFRSDIYSLGTVFYRLLSGKVTYRATAHGSAIEAVVEQIVSKPCVPLSLYRSDIDPAIVKIVTGMIEKDKNRRYSSWDEVLFDICTLSQRAIGRRSDDKEARQFKLLRDCSLFADFSTAELWEVVRAAIWREFQKGDKLIKEGTANGKLYVLINGNASLELGGALLSIIKTGDFAGEKVAFMREDAVSRQSVVANMAVTALEIPRERLLSMSDGTRGRFNEALLRSMSAKLDIANLMLSEAMKAR